MVISSHFFKIPSSRPLLGAILCSPLAVTAQVTHWGTYLVSGHLTLHRGIPWLPSEFAHLVNLAHAVSYTGLALLLLCKAGISSSSKSWLNCHLPGKAFRDPLAKVSQGVS